MNPEEQLPPSPAGERALKLPDLNTTLLDAGQVEQLLRDIELCAQITEIIPKYSAREHVPDAGVLTLDQARELLVTRAVRGLQLRYRHEEADWWDTLMLVGDRFRLVRIRHDFPGEPS